MPGGKDRRWRAAARDFTASASAYGIPGASADSALAISLCNFVESDKYLSLCDLYHVLV